MEPQLPLVEEIRKKLAALPPDVQAFVYSADMEAIIQQVGQKHGLHVDQLGALESEAASVMIGMTKPDAFVESLADVLGIDMAKSKEIATDVNDMLFVKIRESMKQQGNTVNVSTQPPSSPMPKAIPPTPTPTSMTPKPPLSSVLPTGSATMPPPPPPPMKPSAPAAPVASTPAPMPPMKPIPAADPHPTDLTLTQKTVTVVAKPPVAAPPPPPQKPTNYKMDPYREPAE